MNKLLKNIYWIRKSQSYYFSLSLLFYHIYGWDLDTHLQNHKIHHLWKLYPKMFKFRQVIHKNRFWWFLKSSHRWLIFMNLSFFGLAFYRVFLWVSGLSGNSTFLLWVMFRVGRSGLGQAVLLDTWSWVQGCDLSLFLSLMTYHSDGMPYYLSYGWCFGLSVRDGCL